MDNREWIEEIEKFFVNTYNRQNIVIERAEGPFLFDVEGNKILDWLCNYSSAAAGHCHPKIIKAIIEQVGKMDGVSNAVYHAGLLFARELVEFCEYDAGKALLMNSGAEAVERAIKIARKTAYTKMGIPHGEAEILVAEDNFHGRTAGPAAMSGDSIYGDFEPHLPGFIRIPFSDSEALKGAISKNTCAFIVEPIQAEAGVNVPVKGYLRECKEICEDAGILFILDEIQTGFGRTGAKFCWQHENAQPDIIIGGKFSGGNQLPVSFLAGLAEVIDIFSPGQDGSTYAANPLACAVGEAIIEIFKEEKLGKKAKVKGKYLMRRLREEIGDGPLVKEIRGKGLLIGIELTPQAENARKYTERLLFEERLFVKERHEKVIALTPPLNIPFDLLNSGIAKIKRVLEK